MADTQGTDLPEDAAAGEVATDAPARTLPDQPVLRTLFEQFETAVWGQSRGQDTATVVASDFRAFAEAAKAAGFEVCTDVTAVDYHRARRIRFEVVASLLSHQHNLRIRLRVPLAADALIVPSLVPVYPGTSFFERETYDMFGVEFEGHPDLTRILMPDEWVGHPLRKDFATGEVPVQFKDSHKVS
ncbi:MAG: NADH-quinone oxidoreductase subunit C [Acidimicrobiia bacterium]|nr:NADH-quinone oxidoreductase subunit C [Acidimicrobiia bacterium]